MVKLLPHFLALVEFAAMPAWAFDYYLRSFANELWLTGSIIMNNLTKFVLVAIVLTAIVVSIPSFTIRIRAGSNISNWWPVENAEMNGVQPFKALVDGMSINDYQMFWSVDGGQWNWMDNNYTDYPHKEAAVDVSNWRWNSTGIYKVKFIARNISSQIIGEKEFAIKVLQPVAVAVSATAPISSVQAPLPIVNVSSPVMPVTAPIAAPTQMQIWWPTDGSRLTSVQPFKVALDNVNVSNYSMYWQVDGGQLNRMDNSYNEAPHKEAQVDLAAWTWKAAGPYTVTFIAKDMNNSEISRKSLTIYNSGYTGSATPVATSGGQILTPLTPVVTTPIILTGNTSTVSNPADPLSGLRFYVNPNSNARRQEQQWSASRPADASQMEKIASQPEARWLGDWNGNIYNDTKAYVDAAAALAEVPVMITYNIPQRDCGSYSAGGAQSADAYKTWIRNLANGIGSRKAVVILEPDALTLIDCLSPTALQSRYDLIRDAIGVLKSKGNTMVYVDAGHSSWIYFEDMAKRLSNIGVDKADGFALNVSNYQATTDLISYGKSVSQRLGGTHFVIDTSRNGLGSNGEWCNPSGRSLGAKVTTNTGSSLIDAYLWLKNPGESDGTCNGGPSAGVWWPEYALGLAQRASY